MQAVSYQTAPKLLCPDQVVFGYVELYGYNAQRCFVPTEIVTDYIQRHRPS